jgi:hypothetical protein
MAFMPQRTDRLLRPMPRSTPSNFRALSKMSIAVARGAPPAQHSFQLRSESTNLAS